MRPRFCPKCGAKNIEGDLCPACAHAGHPLEQLDIGQLELCAHCRKYKRRNTWIPFKGFREVLRESVSRSADKRYGDTYKVLVPEHELHRLKATLETPKPGLHLEVQVAIKASELLLPRIVQVPILVSACGGCSKHEHYFEGILQLRNAPTDVRAYLKNQFEREKKKGVHVSDERRVQNGVDFYVTSQAFLKKIGTLLHKKFGGTMKMSVRIFTLDKFTSKDVYRLNVHFEPMPLAEGDVFIFDGRLMKLLRRGKQAVYFDFEKNASVSTKSGKLMDVEKMPTKMAVVIKTKPHIEVLDPETYQPVPISNQRLTTLALGRKVKMVEHKGKVWVV